MLCLLTAPALLVLTIQATGRSHLWIWLLHLHYQHLNGGLIGKNVVSVNKELKSPPSSYSPEQDGYTNISTNVPLFHAINALPVMLDPARLDEGGGIDETLRKKKARYHQSCRLMFNNSKLQRAKKRTSFANENTAEDSPNPRKMPRRSPVPSECFLCEKLGQPSQLRHAMMQELNDRVKECALTLSDGKLLAKLSGGDVVALELNLNTILHAW